MTVTARQIITSALTHRLNRLSAGETLDADLAALCLSALNEVADEFGGGGGGYLFRHRLYSATISGASGTLGVDWAGIAPGTPIEGATVNEGGQDEPLDRLTMAQYHEQIRDKTTGGDVTHYAWDGLATVYFWPVPAGQSITLLAMQPVTQFADLDTEHDMPPGYRGNLGALLAERIAPAVVGGVPPGVAFEAARARRRMMAQNAAPAILQQSCAVSPMFGGVGSSDYADGYA